MVYKRSMALELQIGRTSALSSPVPRPSATYAHAAVAELTRDVFPETAVQAQA